jgi:hypothetical protein
MPGAGEGRTLRIWSAPTPKWRSPRKRYWAAVSPGGPGFVEHHKIVARTLHFGEGGIRMAGIIGAERAVPLLRNVLRLTAPNPGVMTGPGTNSYLVGDAHTGFIAIDPGPADADHLQRLWQVATHPDGRGGNLRAIVCTHSHPDHAPGAAPLQALCRRGADQPPILGLPSAPTARAASAFTPDRVLQNQELLALAPRAQTVRFGI